MFARASDFSSGSDTKPKRPKIEPRVPSPKLETEAMREAPDRVRTIVLNDIRFRPTSGIGEFDSVGGFIEAWEESTRRFLWRVQLYRIKYDPALETDVQDVFVRYLTLYNEKLVAVDELSRAYWLDPTNQKVSSEGGCPPPPHGSAREHTLLELLADQVSFVPFYVQAPGCLPGPLARLFDPWGKKRRKTQELRGLRIDDRISELVPILREISALVPDFSSVLGQAERIIPSDGSDESQKLCTELFSLIAKEVDWHFPFP